jgi:hypothetical protein
VAYSSTCLERMRKRRKIIVRILFLQADVQTGTSRNRVAIHSAAMLCTLFSLCYFLVGCYVLIVLFSSRILCFYCVISSRMLQTA